MPQTLARHVTEMGRIRIGAQVPIKSGKNAGKPRPEKLSCFRLTSNSQAALLFAAKKYRGEVRAWTVPEEWRDRVRDPEQKFELFTETDTLDILMRPDSLMNTMFERWEGAYCALRCNGEYILKDGTGKLTGLECQCPTVPEERKALAVQGKACAEVSRISVMLEGLPLGQWRLDTRGFYAPAEIRGLQDLMEACEVDRCVLKATMRLEERIDHKMAQGEKLTLRYPCVVIEPRDTIDALLLEGQRRRQLIGTRPDERQKTLDQHSEDLTGQPVAYTYTPRQLPAPAFSPPPHGAPAVLAEPRPVTPEATDPALTAPLRQEIDQLQVTMGLTPQQRMIWRGQQARKHKAKDFARLPEAVLRSLFVELQEENDPRASSNSPETVSTFPIPEQGDDALRPIGSLVEEDETWRDMLRTTAADLREFLDGTHDADLKERVMDANSHAERLAEDAEATATEGRAHLRLMELLREELMKRAGQQQFSI